jgi:hypothetical protein
MSGFLKAPFYYFLRGNCAQMKRSRMEGRARWLASLSVDGSSGMLQSGKVGEMEFGLETAGS